MVTVVEFSMNFLCSISQKSQKQENFRQTIKSKQENGKTKKKEKQKGVSISFKI